MTTPTHLAVGLGVFWVAMQIPAISAGYTDLALLAGSNLIDLDHLFSRPIYHPARNPFATHFLHKKWLTILILSIACILFRPLAFLGIGLILHFALDYLYTKRVGV